MRASEATGLAAAQRPPSEVLREQDPRSRILLGATG
jgi:hypothetical protein